MEYKDYYKVLGLERNATQDDVKRTYRKLARKFHPDVNKDSTAEAQFKEIGEAYEVLGDAEKRAAYDQLGNQWQQGEEFRPPPNWDAGFEFSGAASEGAGAQFSDFFDTLFGAMRRGEPIINKTEPNTRPTPLGREALPWQSPNATEEDPLAFHRMPAILNGPSYRPC